MSCVDETRDRTCAAQSHPAFVLTVIIPFWIADNVRYLSSESVDRRRVGDARAADTRPPTSHLPPAPAACKSKYEVTINKRKISDTVQA